MEIGKSTYIGGAGVVAKTLGTRAETRGSNLLSLRWCDTSSKVAETSMKTHLNEDTFGASRGTKDGELDSTNSK